MQPQKINPIIELRPDHCVRCDAKRAIELYDNNNKSIGYSFYLDQLNLNRKANLNTRVLRNFKCKSCGEMFMLDWVFRDFPVPLFNQTKKNFFLFDFYHKE